MKARKRVLRNFKRRIYWSKIGYRLRQSKRDLELWLLEKKIDVHPKNRDHLNSVLQHEYQKDRIAFAGGCSNLDILLYNHKCFGDKLPRGRAIKRLAKISFAIKYR